LIWRERRGWRETIRISFSVGAQPGRGASAGEEKKARTGALMDDCIFHDENKRDRATKQIILSVKAGMFRRRMFAICVG